MANVVVIGTGATIASASDPSGTAVAERGTVVGLSTRVPEGPVVPTYGNGGGADLVHAGASCLGSLPLFHARRLRALLMSAGVAVSRDTLGPYI